MPGRDETGPLGEGAMTGGGFGFCQISKEGISESKENINLIKFNKKGYARRINGRGFGAGRVCRNRYFVSSATEVNRENTPSGEKQSLEQQMKSIQEELNQITQRLEILNKGNQS